MDADVQRELQNLKDGRLDVTGVFTAASDGVATTTVVTRQTCSTNSIILVIPTNANAASIDGFVYITPGKGSFTVNHSASTLSRTYAYIMFAPRNTT